MYIAIDVGGTKTHIGQFSGFNAEDLLSDLVIPTEKDYDSAISSMVDSIKTHFPGKINHITIGASSIQGEDKSKLISSSNLPKWVNRELQKDLESALDTKVLVENDTVCAARAEAIFGNGKDKSFLFVIWGTGLGGANVINIDGKVLVFQAEIGHQIIDWNGESCLCGQKGCIGLLCEGDSIRRKYNKGAEDLDEKEWDEVINAVAQALSNAVTIFPQQLIIIGGGIASKQADRMLTIENLISTQTVIAEPPKIILSKFKEKIGLYGALANLKYYLNK